MRALVTIVLAVAATGCASLDNAGYSGIEVRQSASGKGCDLVTRDGKEYVARRIAFDGLSCTLVVIEDESQAFKGQGIAAKAATVLPVTGLQELLGVKP